MAGASASFSPIQHIPPIRRNILSRGLSSMCTRLPWAAPMACAPDAAPELLQAAKLTVDNYVRSGMVVGLGSGRASGLAIQYLGRRMRDGALKDIVGIPMSVSSASEAAKSGIPMDHYKDNLQIDFAFDDADIIEEGTLNAVIGRRKLEGGESIIQEKVIYNAPWWPFKRNGGCSCLQVSACTCSHVSIVKTASKLAFIVSDKQYTRDLDGSIPVLINSGNWIETAEEIDDLFLGDAEVWRRPTSGPAGPLGGDFPLVTKEGHHILDVIFTSPILDLGQVAESLSHIDGVVDHGVIFGIPCTVIIASKDGIQVADNLAKSSVIDKL
ncbi:probable ribose-5-phosphate isomerase 4, chloroplastic isoform X1 [Elaeis guineensis]|uniref:ribose-5-phosphate isomerase n=1 Tax=Elaeis guineensis var. tenera TaxID=51953 RepID=A0A8N4EPT9_ELAGV|nr:probable ribose-5-phosphate isomerase 4, chloroplastic isoform X1 [Elaeis guineensis]